jgi:6-phospho-3-hexuloisomerase
VVIIEVSTDPTSDLANVADALLLIPAATKYRQTEEQESIQPLGPLFDQCVHVTLDTICLHYAEQLREDNNLAFLRHSNME